MAIVLGMVILGGMRFLTATFGFRTASSLSGTPGKDIKVLSYNIHFFKGESNGSDGSASDEVIRFLAKEDPDILCLQEFVSRKTAPSTADSISRILKSKGFYFRINSDNPWLKTDYGMAIYSKYPIVSKRWIRLSTAHNQCLIADIKKDGQIFRVYNVHLESIGLKPEEVGKLESHTAEEREKVRITRSIGSALKRAFIARAKQVRLVKEHSSRCKYPYIIAGDFNDTPVSYSVFSMSRGIKNAFKEKGSGFCRTYNGKYPNFQIDYIMYSTDFEALNYRVAKVNFSDHYPVIATLRLTH